MYTRKDLPMHLRTAYIMQRVYHAYGQLLEYLTYVIIILHLIRRSNLAFSSIHYETFRSKFDYTNESFNVPGQF